MCLNQSKTIPRPHSRPMEKLSPKESVRGAPKVGDRWSKKSQTAKTWILLIRNKLRLSRSLWTCLKSCLCYICHPNSGLEGMEGQKAFLRLFSCSHSCQSISGLCLGDKRQVRGAWNQPQFLLPLLTTPTPHPSHQDLQFPVVGGAPYLSRFPWQLWTWAASREEHIPSCQTFSVTSSALNFYMIFQAGMFGENFAVTSLGKAY